VFRARRIVHIARNHRANFSTDSALRSRLAWSIAYSRINAHERSDKERGGGSFGRASNATNRTEFGKVS
jgi:hypothetical protein